MLCPFCHRAYADEEHLYCPFDGTRLTQERRIDLIRAEPCPEAGAVFGERFLVRGRIGQGGVAEVFLAEDKTSGEPVAVKVMHGRHQRDREMRTRFLREATAASRVGHASIVNIFLADEQRDGAVFLVMEYLFGESLGDMLRREGAVGGETILPIAIQVASALEAAHQVGIIHRDVKPDNIYLVGAPGSHYEIRLLDFGFAKLAEGNLTAVGTAIGTPVYMAPEQVVTDPATARADIYALGVILYKALVGQLPFSHSNDMVLLAHQLFAPPPMPRSVRPEIPEAVEAVILRMLRKQPNNRYPSMAVLIEDLERLLGHREGELFALSPLPHDNDVFEPVGPMGPAALGYFKRFVDK